MDLSIKSPAVDTYRIEMTSHSSDLLLYTPLLLLLHKASQSSRVPNKISRESTVSQDPSMNCDWDMEEQECLNSVLQWRNILHGVGGDKSRSTSEQKADKAG